MSDSAHSLPFEVSLAEQFYIASFVRGYETVCLPECVWEESGFKGPEKLEMVDPERITFILQTDPDGDPDVNDGNLTSKEALILQVLAAQPDLTAAKIAEKAGVSKPTVERTLHLPKEKGIIRREGSTRGKWIILKWRW